MDFFLFSASWTQAMSTIFGSIISGFLGRFKSRGSQMHPVERDPAASGVLHVPEVKCKV